MKRVSKEEFYDIIYTQKLNVHPTPTGARYPYKTVWKYLDYGQYGVVFGVEENGEYFVN